MLIPREAEAAISRMFPGCRAYVADGAEKHESGVVEDADGNTIASFRLLFAESCLDDELPTVTEIRIGQVGQFCGTADEIEQFEQQFASQ